MRCTDPPVSVTSYLHIAGLARIHPRRRQALVKESGTRGCDCRLPFSLQVKLNDKPKRHHRAGRLISIVFIYLRYNLQDSSYPRSLRC